MAATTDYCTTTDVQDRLSQAGLEFVADDDGNGVLSSADLTRVVGAGIRQAAVEINAALNPWLNTLPLPQDDGSLNAELRQYAIAIAVEYVCGQRGGSVPASLQEKADWAREQLGMVMDGKRRVVGVVYPVDQDTDRQREFGLPLVGNPGGRARPSYRRSGYGRRRW